MSQLFQITHSQRKQIKQLIRKAQAKDKVWSAKIDYTFGYVWFTVEKRTLVITRRGRVAIWHEPEELPGLI